MRSYPSSSRYLVPASLRQANISGGVFACSEFHLEQSPLLPNGCHQGNSFRYGTHPSPDGINMITAKRSWTAQAELLNVSRETLDHVAKNLVSVATAETDTDSPYSFDGGLAFSA